MAWLPGARAHSASGLEASSWAAASAWRGAGRGVSPSSCEVGRGLDRKDSARFSLPITRLWGPGTNQRCSQAEPMCILTNHVTTRVNFRRWAPSPPINGLWRRTGGLSPHSPMLLDFVSRFSSRGGFSDLDEVLSSGSVRAVESVAGLNPTKDTEKETGGGLRRLSFPLPGGPSWPQGGRGAFQVVSRKRSLTPEKSQSPPKQFQASGRILDPKFVLSVRPRQMSVNPPKKCSENPEGTWVPSASFLPLPAFGHPMEWPF